MIRRIFLMLLCAASIWAIFNVTDAQAQMAYGRQWGHTYMPRIGIVCTTTRMCTIPKTSGGMTITVAVTTCITVILLKCGFRCTTNNGKTFIRNTKRITPFRFMN